MSDDPPTVKTPGAVYSELVGVVTFSVYLLRKKSLTAPLFAGMNCEERSGE